MYGYIYKTTNLINGKIYIGQHKSDIFDPNYMGSGKLIHRAFDKYGKDNFIVELLVECDNREDINKCEKEQILLHHSDDINIGYNISHGGDGGDVFSMKSDDEKNAIRNIQRSSMLGRILINNGKCQKMVKPDELQQYLDCGFVVGYLHTTERDERRKHAIRKFHDEHPEFRNSGMFKPGVRSFTGTLTDESKAKISKSLTGKQQSDETRIKRSQTMKEKYANGYINPMKNKTPWNKGRKMTEEELKRHSEVRKGHIPWNKGRKGQGAGVIWITNGIIDKRIPKDELDKYKCQGFKRGRIMKGKVHISE